MASARSRQSPRTEARGPGRRVRRPRPPSIPVPAGRPSHRLSETRGRYDAGGVQRLGIAIIDPHPLTRPGIAAVFAEEPRMDVVVAARDLAEMIASGAMEAPVDAIVCAVDDVGESADITGPADATPLVVVARSAPDARLLEAFGAGVRGVVLHDSEPSTLRGAVAAVSAGGTYIDPRLTDRLLHMARRGQRATDDPLGLTVQERRVLRLAAEELTNVQIADQLGLSVNTVKNHLSSAYDKLGVSHRADAVRIVNERG